VDTLPDIVAYWNSRSGLGDMAGTRDLVAKQLEMQTLAECFPVDSTESVIDMGCGNGMTSLYLRAARPGIRIHGVDNSNGMIQHAISLALNKGVPYEYGSVMDYRPKEPVDCVYTERTLVNLPDWDAQKAAIMNILQMLKPGGTYLMMENSQDGVEELNDMRGKLGLAPMVPPWHNRYLRDVEIDSIATNEFGYLDQVINYSSNYYFLSRVVNAWLAKQAGQEPAYDAPINKLALVMGQEPLTTIAGQGRLWVWRRS